MKANKVDITQDEIKKQLSYDPDTGDITRRTSTAKCVKVGDIAGWVENTGYRRIMVSGVTLQAHRIVWIYMTGSWPVDQIDHINGDRSDNRFSNLREVNNSDNSKNQKVRVDNESGIAGVRFRKDCGKWQARVSVNGNRVSLGHFDDIKSAELARLEANIKYGFHENHGRAK